MKKIAVVFVILILGLSIIPLSLQAYDGEIKYVNPDISRVIDRDEVRSTLYIGGEGRSRREMLACALWLEKNWSRLQSGKVSKDEKCENFSTDDFVILYITQSRGVLGENSYYIDYTNTANIKSNQGLDSKSKKSRLTDEFIDELAEDISALNEKAVDLHKLYEGLSPEQKEEFQKIWIEEWLKFQKENPDLKIEFK